MITQLSEQEVVKYGSHFMGERLFAQSGMTVGLVQLNLPAFNAELGPEFLPEVQTIADAVHASYGDRELAEEERRTATVAQNDKIRAAKVWRRRVASFGQRLALRGVEVPVELREVGRSVAIVTSLQSDLQTKLAKLRGLTLTGALQTKRNTLVQTGDQVSKALGTADSAQEVKVETLPAKTRKYWYNKGLLYLGIKQINVTAKDIFADVPQQSAMFNMRLLYHKTDAPGQPASATGSQPANPQ